MGNKTKEYYFIESFIKYIDSNSYFDSDDEIQRTFIMNIKNSNITLIIKPNIIKKAEKYNINYTKKKDNSYSFGIDYSPNDDNKINDSYSNSFKELLNNNKIIINEKNLDERNKIEKIENLNKNDSQFLNHNKPLTQKEESKDNKNILKRSKSSQKANLKFGNKMEHVNIESKKSKENKEKYLNPLEVIEGKNNNEIKPKGLYNFSLNNYMNSLLQCLFHIKELREYFINNQNKFTDDRPVCKAFAEVMNELKNSDNDYVEPKRFKKLIGKDSKLFLGCKAGDVKDLFINLIDTFLTELNKENINEVSTNNNIDYTDKKQMFREALKEIDNDNIINKIFIGFYETMYQCKEKSIKIYSMQAESFLLFELEKIKNYFNTSYLSIELGFKYYYREQLNTEFYCSECKVVHKGNAYEKIYRPPKILLIVLDRGYGKTFKGDVEINKYLDITNIIDEKKYNKYSCLYKLICISTHKGTSSSSGQYTARCLSDNNKYYYFNDKYVQEIDENNLFNDEPYLLFYEQIDNKDKINKEIKTIQNFEYINNYKEFSQDGKKEKKLTNIKQSLKNNIPLSKQEESKNNYNYNLTKKARSLQKENLKFGNKMEHVNIESQKSKEKTDKYINPLGVIREINNNEIKPKGLYNIGLNCYMNSLLQCLFYIKELRDYFINNQNKFESGQQICKAFAEVMNELKNSDNDYVEPKQFKKLMGNTNNLFKGCKAGDVKDLYINLIDSLLSELNKENSIQESENNNNIDYSNKKEMFKEALKEIDGNIINKIFIGFYETMYQCTNVNTFSFQTESFLLFELEKIKNYFDTKKLSLELCFKYYYREQLNVEFYCSECKVVHKGNAYEKIYRPPKILLIILDRGHGKTFKGDVEINKYLDLKNIIDEKRYKSSYLYKLICISTHSGTSSSSGHYTACCLVDNNKYYYFSDTYVHEIDENNLFNDEPYLLFYEQIDNEDKNGINKNEIKTIKIDNYKTDKNELSIIKKETKLNQINEQQKKLSYYKLPEENKSNIEKNQRAHLYQKRNKEEKFNNNIQNNIKEKGANDNEMNNTYKRRIIKSSNNNLNENYKNIDKNNNFIETILKLFIKNSYIKYSVDYYYKNKKDPNTWKLTIIAKQNSIFEGNIFNFKLDFNKNYEKLYNIIELENDVYQLNQEIKYLLKNREYNGTKSFYEKLKELFDFIYKLFNEPYSKLQNKFSKEIKNRRDYSYYKK